jgi:hypothetical protein
MRDPKIGAIEVLRGRNQPDAARALAECDISLRHVDAPLSTGRSAGAAGRGGLEEDTGRDLPQADVLIHAPPDVLSSIKGTELPQGSWSQEIELAVTETLSPRISVRHIQWAETRPGGSPRPGTFGLGDGSGRGGQSARGGSGHGGA